MTCPHTSPALLVGLSLVLLPAMAFGQLSDKELRKRIEPWFEQSPYSVEAQRDRQTLAAELEVDFGEFDERDAKNWREELLKLWAKGLELPKKSGDRWYYEDEKPKRGRYIVGGKTSKPKGLMIAMHGGGVGSADAGGAASWYSGPASSEKWVMIAPQALEATELGWTTSGTEEWVLDLVDQARRTWDIDANRVYFAGHSMGGYGSWTLGAHHADRVAALAPSAGAPTPYLNRQTDEVEGIVDGIVPSLRNTPMVVFQSIDDPRVPPGPNQFAARQVAEAAERWGGYENFTYWEVDGVGHGPPKEGVGAHIEKIAGFERDPLPLKLVWQPDLAWKQQFHWIHWDAPVIGAIVVAERTEGGSEFELTVTRANGQPMGSVKGLRVLLDERVVEDLDAPIVVRLNGEVLFEGVAERSLHALLITSQTGDPGLQFEAAAPRFTSKAPISGE